MPYRAVPRISKIEMVATSGTSLKYPSGILILILVNCVFRKWSTHGADRSTTLQMPTSHGRARELLSMKEHPIGSLKLTPSSVRTCLSTFLSLHVHTNVYLQHATPRLLPSSRCQLCQWNTYLFWVHWCNPWMTDHCLQYWSVQTLLPTSSSLSLAQHSSYHSCHEPSPWGALFTSFMIIH